MGQLSDSQLRGWLKQGAPLKPISDGDGLTFEITTGGSKKGRGTWSLRYRYAGKQKPMVIGRYPEISLADARVRAARLRVQIHDGLDPMAERRRRKAALSVARTFKELVEDYLCTGTSTLSERTRIETRRHIEKDLLPALGSLRLDDITGAEVVALTKRIAKRSHSVAQRCFDITNVIFAHGVASIAAKSNPCSALRLAAIIGTRKKRERVQLTENELRNVLTSLPRVGLKNALAIRVLLACCARKSELLKARWEDIDLDAATWSIPAENTKSRRSLVIPLPPIVVDWFHELQEMACGSPWVLSGQRLSEHMADNTLNAAIQRLGADTRKWTPHDLRSTARSYLTSLGVDVIVAEKCLGHKLGGLLDVYDKGGYLIERRHALQLWAAFIARCEQPSLTNVVSLREVRAA